MLIHSIKKLRGKKGRYRVTFDDESILEVSEWTLVTYGIRKGDTLTESELERIRSAETAITAKDWALRYLSYRPRSAQEVFLYLRKKGFPDVVARGIIDDLQRSNFLNDRVFAAKFLNDQLLKKPQGIHLLRQRLLAKGIDPSVIDTLLATRISPQEQEHAAVLLINKKYKTLLQKKKFHRTDYQKIYSYLYRKGFPNDIIRKVLNSTIGITYDTE